MDIKMRIKSVLTIFIIDFTLLLIIVGRGILLMVVTDVMYITV
jgi:hypothetical protein